MDDHTFSPARKYAKSRRDLPYGPGPPDGQKGERCDRCLWQRKGAERVAAVGKKQACFDRRSFCRAPQQDSGTNRYSNRLMWRFPLWNPFAPRLNRRAWVLSYRHKKVPPTAGIPHISLEKREYYCNKYPLVLLFAILNSK